MSSAQRATDLREALIAQTLDEVVRLHDAVQAIGPTLQAAVAQAAAQAKQEVQDSAQAQALFVEQQMLKDREKFVQEQKALLKDLGQELKNRDTWLTALMAEILKKARAQLTEEMEQAAMKATATRKQQERREIRAMLLGVGCGVMALVVGISVGMLLTGAQ